MTINELLGKTITNIYVKFGIEQGWLYTATCFIELDNNLIVAFPFAFSEEVWIRDLDPQATSIFTDLSDYPVHHVNKDGTSIGEIAASYGEPVTGSYRQPAKAF